MYIMDSRDVYNCVVRAAMACSTFVELRAAARRWNYVFYILYISGTGYLVLNVRRVCDTNGP